GDPGDCDIINKAARVLDDQRQALLVAGRGGKADDVEARGPRRKGQLGILLGRQIDDDDAVDSGGDRIAREGFGAMAVDRVVVAHQYDRGGVVSPTQLANERESTA